ncbi:hypothetical protein VULLAG_LOCUS19638 [Vulpes lagopus]
MQEAGGGKEVGRRGSKQRCEALGSAGPDASPHPGTGCRNPTTRPLRSVPYVRISQKSGAEGPQRARRPLRGARPAAAPGSPRLLPSPPSRAGERGGSSPPPRPPRSRRLQREGTGTKAAGAPGSRGAEPPLPGPRPSPGRAGALPAGGGAGDARTRTKPRRPRAAPRASSGRRRARPHRSSAAREEEKQQPPHSSGRATGERGELELPRFPQLQTAGRGNDAARGALPASTATRKSGREGRPRGHAPAPLPPRRLAGAPPIAGARRRARGDAGARARRPGTPGGCLATATPSASPGMDKGEALASFQPPLLSLWIESVAEPEALACGDQVYSDRNL